MWAKRIVIAINIKLLLRILRMKLFPSWAPFLFPL